jgi:hypothetical protein
MLKFCKVNNGLVEMALRKIKSKRLKTVDHILQCNKINLLKSPTTDDCCTKLELLQFQLRINFLAIFGKALILLLKQHRFAPLFDQAKSGREDKINILMGY